MPAVVPVAVKVCAMVDPADAVAPVTPVCATVQVNVVPVTLLVSSIEDAVAEQIVCEAGVAVAIGVGFTVMSTTLGVPLHPFAVGVTV